MDTIDKLATAVAETAAPHADRHDLDGSFVVEGVSAARDLGYLAAAAPAELGGSGGLTADFVRAQRIVAAACPSTALACSMHLHVVLAAAWRWRRGDTVVEPMLRRVGTDRIVVASSGGNDWVRPTTVATPVEGGWRVSGRKAFGSISPVADVMATFAVIGVPEPGAEVIAFGLPLKAEGVRIDETWDAAGMRGTGSHDVVLEDVFVADAQVTARRTWGELDRPLLVASLHAWPVVYATYLGVAEALFETVLASGKVGVGSARLVGAADFHLRVARWALEGALADLGDDPDPTVDNFVSLQQMKREVTVACQEVGTLAAELAGGGAYARRGAVDRMIRDVRAALYHPYPPETTLLHAGRHRLGLPLDPL
ncbi:MAG TPA: acyl-CoA dehydrogenase family protein [Acidimicrobiales bacterium]|nr:acyl-CoA dehydrogenase family protein [Acidimicrobiales bacterium]